MLVYSLQLAFIAFVALLVLYHFYPSLQMYVDEPRLNYAEETSRLGAFLADRSFDIPTEIQTTLTPGEHYAVYGSGTWGSPEQDGLDKGMPGRCWWQGGVLYCVGQPLVSE